MTPFIPESELTPLLQNSFQETSARISFALKDELHRFGGQAVHLVATHPSYAVVMSESGSAYRIGYEISEEGRVHFTTQDVIPVTVVTGKNARQYVRAEARKAADLLVQGFTKQASERIAAIFPLIDSANISTDREIIDSFMQSRESVAKKWKSIAESRAEDVRQYLGESAPSTQLKPKFKKLYDGSTPSAELPKFSVLVQEDVSFLHARLSKVKTQAEESLSRIRAVKDSAEAEGGASVVTTLESYVDSLLSDVGAVLDFLQECRSDFRRADELAQVFDSIAPEVSSFEVAGAFAEKMTTRLAEAGR